MNWIKKLPTSEVTATRMLAHFSYVIYKGFVWIKY